MVIKEGDKVLFVIFMELIEFGFVLVFIFDLLVSKKVVLFVVFGVFILMCFV